MQGNKQSQAVISVRKLKGEPLKEKYRTFSLVFGNSKIESAREKARVVERAWEDEQWRKCEE